MPFRAALQKLIRRDPAASLRDRADELRARIPAPKPTACPAAPAEPAPTFSERVARAGHTGDVLAASGIDHRDGTVSYADADGNVSRRPMAHWIAFNAMQMHAHVQAEISRQRVSAYALPTADYDAWETRIRRELRADAITALTLNPQRAFKAEEARRSGAEPITTDLRAAGDADLVALLPEWEAARDAYDEASDRQLQIVAAAEKDGRPGPAPAGSGPDWQDWFQLSKEWRERTGVEAAEEASGEACRVLGAIEDRIAELPAASLAGLRLKARVAQRNEDIDIEWPEKLGSGLTRDLLAFTAEPEVDWHSPPPGFMASPAIEPMNFARIPQGLRIELERLNAIAQAEYRRRTSALRETGNDTHERKAAIRASLFLPALTAAVDPGSTEAAVLAALSRPAGPDPILALIEEHRVAYAEWDRLSEVWAGMGAGTPEHREAMVASAEPGQREIAAYDALLAARPTTLAGAVAFATYMQEATDRTSQNVEPSDAERALAVVADAVRAVLAAQEGRPRRDTSIVESLDLAAATVPELQALRDTARMVGDVAQAASWQGRCQKAQDGGRTDNDWNMVGELMVRLADELTAVEDAAMCEAERRQPESLWDRRIRLSMLAEWTISGGDPTATAALIADLATFTADQARR